MNRLAFDPKKYIIQQWRDVYLNMEQISKFQSLINQLYIYLDVVLTHKIRFLQKESKKNELISGQKRVILEGITISKAVAAEEQIHQERHQIEDVCKKIQEIGKIKENFLFNYDDIFRQNKQMQKKDNKKEEFILNLVAKYKSPQNYGAIEYSKIDFNKLFQVFERYYSNLESDILQFYSCYMDRNDELIQIFIEFKASALRTKITDFKSLKRDILSKEKKKDVSELEAESYFDIKTLFENLFIEGHYLGKFMQFTLTVFERFEDVDNNAVLLEPIRNKHKQKMKVLQDSVEKVRKQIREIYVSLYDTTKAQRSDQNRLQRFICSEVAVNKAQFQEESSKITFINGLLFATLLFSLAGILVFRGMTLSALEQNSSYMNEFKIWRGASYLIFTNWIIAIVLSIFDYCKINYRLILIESDSFVPKPQAFFQTAIILSSIYLILFLVYLLKALDFIEGHDLMEHLGYFMWLINIAFMLNPFKVLNYQGRKYFMWFLLKFLISPFKFINLNMFSIGMLFSSFVQPYADFSFTVCHLVYSSSRTCVKQTSTSTFIFILVLLLIGFGQCIRFRMQIKTQQIFSRPILGIISITLAINNVIASYIYNIYLTQGLFTYWIVSAIASTIAAVNTDIRSFWGLIVFDQKGCKLRSFLTFSPKIYYFGMVIDLILNVGWVFTISNNLSFADSINPMYFLMILSYIELARKGIFIIFRVEEDHSSNVGNLDALQNDQSIYDQLKEKYHIAQKKEDLCNNITEQHIQQSPANFINKQIEDDQDKKQRKQSNTITLQQLQLQILQNKAYLQKVEQLEEELQEYLSTMYKMYRRLELEENI